MERDEKKERMRERERGKLQCRYCFEAATNSNIGIIVSQIVIYYSLSKENELPFVHPRFTSSVLQDTSGTQQIQS